MNMITQSFGAIDPGRAADRRGSHDSFVAGPIVVCKCHPAFESVTRLGDSSHRIQYWEEHVPAASVEMQGHAVRFQFFIICPGTVDSSEQGPRVAANAETEFGQSANSRLRQLFDQPLNFGASTSDREEKSRQWPHDARRSTWGDLASTGRWLFVPARPIRESPHSHRTENVPHIQAAAGSRVEPRPRVRRLQISPNGRGGRV